MARDVFISYRSEDKKAADQLCEALEKQSISCWIAPRDIPPGTEWAEAIVEGIRRCSSFVLILSANSRNARQISREAELADKNGLPIITFRIENVEPPPGLLYFLGNIQWLDIFSLGFDNAVAKLVNVIQRGPKYPAETTAHALSLGGAAAPRAAPQPAPVPPPPVNTATPEPVAIAGKRGLNPMIVGGGIAAVVVLGVLIWAVSRGTDAKKSDRPSAAAIVASKESERAEDFGAKYLRLRNSKNPEDASRAWDMLGPKFQAPFKTRDKFVEFVKAQGGGTGATPKEGRCALNSGGNYNCEYVLVTGAETSKEKLVVVKKGDGGWQIAKDKMWTGSE